MGRFLPPPSWKGSGGTYRRFIMYCKFRSHLLRLFSIQSPISSLSVWTRKNVIMLFGNGRTSTLRKLRITNKSESSFFIICTYLVYKSYVYMADINLKLRFRHSKEHNDIFLVQILIFYRRLNRERSWHVSPEICDISVLVLGKRYCIR